MVAEADSGRILVVEDDCAAAGLLRTYLNDLGYRVTVATSGGQGLAYALEHRPAAILLDVLLPDTDGWHVLRELKRQPATRDIPVIISTVLDQNEVGVALGAVDYLVKPVEPDALVTLLRRHALRPAPAGCESVLAIDDDPATLDLVAATLARHGVRTETAATGHAGLELARRGHHDLIICDLRLPDIDGFTIVATLRDQPDTANIPIVVLTAGDLSEQDTARLAGGVVDIVTKGERARERLSEWLVRLGATSHGEVASPAVGAGTGAEGGRAGATAPLVSVVVAPAVASTVAAVGGERE
jgi:CheY-like chemotaxis protein